VKEPDDLLRQTATARRLAVERQLAPFEITPAQFVVMEWLDQTRGQSGADLARRERQTPATTSVAIGNLERKGLVIRNTRVEGGRARSLE
jgi:DNA-binding MarR family transcriptional regulator